MARENPWNDEVLRLRALFAVMIALFLVLAGRFWQIQIHRGPMYEQDQFRQSIRRVRLPGVRGRLFDRHGRAVADNRPSYTLSIYLEELRKPGSWDRTIDAVEELLRTLSPIVGSPPRLSRTEIRNHIRKQLPLPLHAWRDLDEAAMARFAELAGRIPGVDIQADSTRVYPFGSRAAHVLGYVGRADASSDDGEEPFHYYLPEVAGRSGLEKTLDPLLRGEAGGRLVRVDVTGYRRYDFGQRDPRPGRDVMLTLDMRVQGLAEQALGEDPGAVVVLDPRNGDILAMASRPAFDPNEFVPSIPPTRWRQLNQDPKTPLLNRAVAGGYAPGSTFKLVTALAALESGRSHLGDIHTCSGSFQLGRTTFRCWFHPGHGVLNLRQAIEQSCNVYFFEMGLAAGIARIHEMASRMGLGSRTGVELDFEVAGLVPNDEWKRRTQRDAWRDGDTCNVAIGQGAIVVTPLQMAQVTMLIANGGRLYRPRLVRGIRDFGADSFAMNSPVLVREMNWHAAVLEAVRLGMRDVVHGERGTARRVAISGVTVAGKTGTAEFGRKEDRRRHAWMVAYAPFDAPRYAISIVVDEGISGGETAAPRMRLLLEGLLAANDSEGQG
ncbi:MAG: penicillin-binding protein 2 [Kiritimatiellae bacterium]|nr:penicillin-binding protein 2 [Kiritimatiellia bacterium]MDW8458199.1 penicillin-binding protein 2 [Verrucomicrobiota bacterium]